MSKRSLHLCLSVIPLTAFVACGGGGGGGGASSASPSTALSLSYTDPKGVSSTSYSLNRDIALSTPDHLVLDLYGPATLTGSGVVLTLDLDITKATWGYVSGSDPVVNGSVFANPVVKGKISSGTLQVVTTERGFGSPKAFNGPLLKIALDLKAGQVAGSTIVVTPDLSRSQVLLGTGSVMPLPDISVGTLITQ